MCSVRTPRNEDARIYVGYLPVPRRHRSFLRWTVPTALWAMCGASLMWARSQHSPGTGVWDDGQPIRLHGTLAARPYPVLFAKAPDGTFEGVLLVEAGKHGGGGRAAGMDGKAVEVSGWPLHRDGRRMLELEPGAAGLLDSGEAQSPPPMGEGRQTVLRGEIVDSKCFLGAMKPGEGKTHKECATLCVRGGIPPVLVTRDAAGRAEYYLLRDPSGGPMDTRIEPLIADPVEVRGTVAEWGGLRVLTVRFEDVRRL